MDLKGRRNVLHDPHHLSPDVGIATVGTNAEVEGSLDLPSIGARGESSGLGVEVCCGELVLEVDPNGRVGVGPIEEVFVQLSSFDRIDALI